MSWHLRLGKQEVLLATVTKKTVRQLDNALEMEPLWQMATEDLDNDLVLARFTRKPKG